MSIRFVKTGILSSADGLDFNVEEKVENEESRKARLAKEDGLKKPLYEQLQEQKEKKDAEFEANRKLMSLPAKLDEEDIKYLNSLEENRNKKEEFKLMNEKMALESFRLAQKASKDKHNAIAALAAPEKEEKSKAMTVPVIKRKLISNNAELSADNVRDDEKSETKKLKKSAIEDTNGTNDLSTLFGGYGSDEDD